MSNSIFTINPYMHNGMWVFDDPRVGLDKEPFVAGADDIIDFYLAQKQFSGPIHDPNNGFVLVFSTTPFPGHDFVLEWQRQANGGNVYAVDDMEGWLCPALLLYYPDPPQHIYVQFRSRPHE